MLMVKTGGGHQQLLEFLEHKGYFHGSAYAEEVWKNMLIISNL